jgi:hypothetical protein
MKSFLYVSATEEVYLENQKVNYGRNYWTKLEPFSSNNFCPDGQKSRPAFPFA